DLLVPGLGGWSARWTRAVKASPAARPPEKMKWMVCRVPVAFQIATGDDARSLRPPALLPAKICACGAATPVVLQVQGMMTAVPWSVPAFLPSRVSVGSPLLRLSPLRDPCDPIHPAKPA